MLSSIILGIAIFVEMIANLLGGMGNNAMTPVADWMGDHVSPIIDDALQVVALSQ